MSGQGSGHGGAADRRVRADRRDGQRGGGRRDGDGDELMTVAQAARESGYSKRTIWHHIAKGALLIIHIGPFRRPRIRRDEFARYLKVD